MKTEPWVPSFLLGSLHLPFNALTPPPTSFCWGGLNPSALCTTQLAGICTNVLDSWLSASCCFLVKVYAKTQNLSSCMPTYHEDMIKNLGLIAYRFPETI